MSLTLTRADLEDEVGRALGYGRGTLTGDPLADVTACIERGLRQFYTPEVLQGERTSHRWSFLRTVESLDTHAASEEKTGSFSGNTFTIAASGVLLTTDVASVSHVTVGTTKYLASDIAGGGNTIDLTGYSGSDTKITVHYNGTYALPTAFAGIDGPMTYDTFYGTDPNVADQTIEITTEAKLRDMAQYLEDRDDKPRVAAIFKLAQLAPLAAALALLSTQSLMLYIGSSTRRSTSHLISLVPAMCH